MSGTSWPPSWVVQPILVSWLSHPTQGNFLIDTGLHPRLLQQGWPVRCFLQLAGMQIPLGPLPRPESLQGLIVSHLHLDHVAGLLDWPGLPLWTSAQGYRWAKSRTWSSGICPGLLPPDLPQRARWLEDFPMVLSPLPGRDLFGDGSVLAVELPGHCPGQHGLYCQTERGPVFFVADAVAHSRILSENRQQRLPCLLAESIGQERRTREWLRSLAAPPPGPPPRTPPV